MYFMHLFNDLGQTPDDEGMDLPDEEAARQRAEVVVRELIAEDVRGGRNQIHITLRIEDQAGGHVFTLAVSAEVSGFGERTYRTAPVPLA